MDDAARDNHMLSKAVVFLNHFDDLPDPRQRCEVMYPLDEIPLLALLAVSGAGGGIRTLDPNLGKVVLYP